MAQLAARTRQRKMTLAMAALVKILQLHRLPQLADGNLLLLSRLRLLEGGKWALMSGP